MNKRIPLFIAVILLINIPGDVYTCTVAVISGEATPDGRPLLWKNRDSSHRDNAVQYYHGPKYKFIGIINSGDTAQVWMGVNEAGLAIMNSESKDLEGSEYDDEGYLMKYVLGHFATVEEFQEYLESTNVEGRAVTSNFGVIDAQGRAGFFETGNHTYTFFDANTAPHGFLTRANYAETGDGEGYGYYRCGRATELLEQTAKKKAITHKYILQQVARDIQTEEVSPYPFESIAIDTIPTSATVNRHRTVSAAVFHGAKPGENPLRVAMWCILGEPIAGVATPFWVASGGVGEAVEDSENGAKLNRAIQDIESQMYPNSNETTLIFPRKVAQNLNANLVLENLILEATWHFLENRDFNQPDRKKLQKFQEVTQQAVFLNLTR